MSDFDTVASVQHKIRNEEHDFSQTLLNLRIVTGNYLDEVRSIQDRWQSGPPEEKMLAISSATGRLLGAVKYCRESMSERTERTRSLREGLRQMIEREDASRK